MDHVAVFDHLGFGANDVVQCPWDLNSAYAILDVGIDGDTIVHDGVALVMVPAEEAEKAADEWAKTAHHCIVGLLAEDEAPVKLTPYERTTLAVATDGRERDYHGQVILGIKLADGRRRRGCRLADDPLFVYNERAKIHLLAGKHHYCPAFGGTVDTIYNGILPLSSWASRDGVEDYVLAIPVRVLYQLEMVSRSVVQHFITMKPMYDVGPCPDTDRWFACILSGPTVLRRAIIRKASGDSAASEEAEEVKAPEPPQPNF